MRLRAFLTPHCVTSTANLERSVPCHWPLFFMTSCYPTTLAEGKIEMFSLINSNHTLRHWEHLSLSSKVDLHKQFPWKRNAGFTIAEVAQLFHAKADEA